MTAGHTGEGLRLVQRPEMVEAALWRRVHFEGDSEARNQLFALYRALALSVARREFRRTHSHGLERAEFEQLACVGLLEAIDRFDPLRGAPFAAFAGGRIRGAIFDGLAKSSERAAHYAHVRRRERFDSLLPSQPTAAPLEALVELTVAIALGLLAEDGSSAMTSSGACETDEPYVSLAWRELEQALQEEIARLPDVERHIIKRHYSDGVTFSVIASELSLSAGRVSQLHRAALLRVKSYLRRLE